MTVTKFTSKSANFVKSLFLIYQIVPSVLRACVCERACVHASEVRVYVCVCVIRGLNQLPFPWTKIFISLKLLSVHSYGQSFIITVQCP